MTKFTFFVYNIIMKYKKLFFDVDNTLLDFWKAEEFAFLSASKTFNLPSEKENYPLYHEINDKWWKKLERKECLPEEVLLNRFIEYFETVDFKVNPYDFNKTFFEFLCQGNAIIDGANEVLKALKEKGYDLYIITNGVEVAQRKRLENQEFMNYISGIFTSQSIGATKPSIEFFNRIEERYGIKFTKDSLIIGDSLTSDIKGGINIGIDTCWFNKDNLPLDNKITPTYTIKSLFELLNIL